MHNVLVAVFVRLVQNGLNSDCCSGVIQLATKCVKLGVDHCQIKNRQSVLINQKRLVRP